MTTTNPDPKKYAFTEEGIAYLPKQCHGIDGKSCYDLFTPVAENQTLCAKCGGEIKPDTLPDMVKLGVQPPQKLCMRKGFVKATPEAVLAYSIGYSKARSKRITATKKGDILTAEKWQLVIDTLMKRYKKREDIEFKEIVQSIFGQSSPEFISINNGHIKSRRGY